MIDLHVELIRGFGQSDACDTGLERIEDRLQKFSSPTTRIRLSKWNEHWKGRARRIDDDCARDARIVVASYSWGVGYGARMLAKQLQNRGRCVDRLFAIDGVYHSRWMPWRAVWGPLSERLFGPPVIWLPSSVLDVVGWRQSLNWPSGHEIRVEDWIPSIHGIRTFRTPRLTELQRTHENIDESPEIQDAVYECVKNYATPSSTACVNITTRRNDT